MNRIEFEEFFKQLAEYYKIPLPNMKFYWEDLQDFLLVEVRKACREHRQDEKRGSYFPTVADIVKRIKRDAKTQGFACYFTSCNEHGKYRVGYSEPAKYLCQVHYDAQHEKTDLDKIRDALIDDFEQETKALGISNRELFMRKNPKVYAELTKQRGESERYDGMKQVGLLAKLAGKA